MDISISQATLNAAYGIGGTILALWLLSVLKIKSGLRTNLMLLAVIVGAGVVLVPYLGLGGAATLATAVQPAPAAPASGPVTVYSGAQTVYLQIPNLANTSTSGVQYLAGNVSIYEHNTKAYKGTVRVEATASGGSWTTAVPGVGYDLFLTSVNNLINSAWLENYVVKGSGDVITLPAYAAGTLTFRMYDATNSLWMYNTGDSSTTTLEASGTRFSSTTNNVTGTALTTNQHLKVNLEVTPTVSETKFGDLGLDLVISDETSASGTASFAPENAGVSMVGSSGVQQSATLYASYSRLPGSGGFEKAFALPVTGLTGFAKTISLDVPPVAGVNPSANVTLTLISNSRYAYGSNGEIVSGITKKDGSTFMHTVQTAKVWVT